MPTWILRLGDLDQQLLHAMVMWRRARLDAFIRVFTHLGDASASILVAGILSLGLVPGLETAGRTAAFALVFSHVLVQLLKRSFARPRPHLPIGIQSLVRAPDRFSFPSGHAAAALSIFLPVALVLPILPGILALAVGFGVGLTRCYLGIHYPGDVLVGWSLAAISVLLAQPLMILLS